ncbi:paraquat-inducible protein A [Klebsiella pneumoniae subsp. pneumoniae]|nr:paraquat-inducible protein A [Klebsiella pneumoniae subsp. pneumoniae]
MGGADCLAGFPLSGQPVANLHHLRQRRARTTRSSRDHLLASSNIAIAGVVFIASILVPFTKVIVLFTLLLSIQFKCEQGLRTRILLLRLITWIGRWSMLDLFVISLTMSLINRDQLLAFTMGPAAVYFGGAVILTILAVEWLDSRLLWDAHESGKRPLRRLKPE